MSRANTHGYDGHALGAGRTRWEVEHQTATAGACGNGCIRVATGDGDLHILIGIEQLRDEYLEALAAVRKG